MKRTQANHRTGSRLGSLFRYQLLGTFSFKKPTKETSTLKKQLPSMCRCNKYQSSFEGSRPIKKLLDWLFEALIHWGKLVFKVTQTNSWLKWMLAWYFSLSKKISPEKTFAFEMLFWIWSGTGADSKRVNFDKSQVHWVKILSWRMLLCLVQFFYFGFPMYLGF